MPLIVFLFQNIKGGSFGAFRNHAIATIRFIDGREPPCSFVLAKGQSHCFGAVTMHNSIINPIESVASCSHLAGSTEVCCNSKWPSVLEICESIVQHSHKTFGFDKLCKKESDALLLPSSGKQASPNWTQMFWHAWTPCHCLLTTTPCGTRSRIKKEMVNVRRVNLLKLFRPFGTTI